jgi:hypothetical protein
MRARYEHLLWCAVACLASLAACADDGLPGDDADDVEIADDAKADGWMIDLPQGTYSNVDAGTSQVAKLTLNADRTFVREVKGTPAVEGTYKFTQSGANRYIRFLTTDGILLDRYGFDLHGRQLLIRKVGTSDGQPLMAEDNFGAVDSPHAGTYTTYGRGALPDGTIFELTLQDTGRFYMTVEGLDGCQAAGHHCPSTWTSGYTGMTNIFGTWTDKTDGVTLTPRDPATGTDGSTIDLAMLRSGTEIEITGMDGSFELVGSMDVQALFSGPHSANAGLLDGTWTVGKVGSVPDGTISLWRFALTLNGSEHRATFDEATNEFCELSPNINTAPKCGIFQIASDPAGGTLGVIYAYRGTEFTALRITAMTATQIKVASDQNTEFTLTRE